MSVVEYALPTVAGGSDEPGFHASAVEAAMVRPRLWLTDCAGDDESVTATLTLNVPVCVGVPLIAPVEEANDKPEGRPLAIQCNGDVPPLALSVVEYAWPEVPEGNVALGVHESWAAVLVELDVPPVVPHAVIAMIATDRNIRASVCLGAEEMVMRCAVCVLRQYVELQGIAMR